MEKNKESGSLHAQGWEVGVLLNLGLDPKRLGASVLYLPHVCAPVQERRLEGELGLLGL